jgi:hypothetical protein
MTRYLFYALKPVFRILGTVPLNNESGADPDADPAPDPALFVNDLQDANKNIIFFSQSFYAYPF